MATSNLQLERFRLQRLTIDFNEDWLALDDRSSESAEDYEVEADFDIWESPEKENLHMTLLQVDCRPKSSKSITRFRHIGIALWGIFAVDPELDQETKDRLVSYNSVAILHGIARGVITGATGSCVGGSFLLPVVNYVEIVERKTEESASEGAAEVEESENE